MVKFGFNQAGMLDEVTAEARRFGLDVGEAIKFDAVKMLLIYLIL